MRLSDTVGEALDRLHPGGPLGLAVSGGGDSIALLHLAADWAARKGVALSVASVDHALRADSRAEAEGACRAAAALGLPAVVLPWGGWTGHGNLQAAARAARTRLLSDWAMRQGLGAVALGHTRDDQAETVLLRLARGAGPDGLAAMAPSTRRGGMLWLRPLLDVARADLRAWLVARGIAWVDDPSNADGRFQRVRARAALAALAPVGIDAAGLAGLAVRMQATVSALDAAAADLAREAVQCGACGDITVTRARLGDAPAEIALRLLAACVVSVSGAATPPRRAALLRLLAALKRGEPACLHGCIVSIAGVSARVMRETAAMGGLDGDVWDRRWRILSRDRGWIGPLGASGLSVLARAARGGCWQPPAAWTATPRGACAATPALWQAGRLACAPLAAYGHGLRVARVAAAPPFAGCVEKGGRALT